MAFWDELGNTAKWGFTPYAMSNFMGAGRGYDEAAKRMEEQLYNAGNYYRPYREAGERAIPQFEQWMNQYKNPQEFMNNVFANYSMSPGAKYKLGQTERAANNAASASGMIGSSAHMREAGNIANQISSEDMQQYLQNYLGIGGIYGQGLNSMMGQGFNAAGGSAGLMGNNAAQLGQLYGGGTAERQNQQNQMIAMLMQSLPYFI